MKTNYYLAALATIILAMAGLAYAQQEYYDDSGVHYLETAQVTSTPVIHEHAGKTGKLKIATPANLGGVTLKPGEYLVRHIDAGKEHFVEFSQMVDSNFVPEGMSPYQEQVIARVNCTREPLNTVVARTELTPKTNGTMASLEIRGEKVGHRF
ncbi:MAG: hypothetical protein LAN70_03895 [Acidobacteriia bacterium]|nr:hypothetical protein [Terriglobia bacterium]